MRSKSNREKNLRLTVTGLFTAMTVILSMSIFSVPVPGGHLYFCDTVINTAALFLDPLSAFVVGGIGSFLGDFIFYPAPMFVSLVTHGLQAAAVSLLSRRILQKRPVLSASVAVSVGAVIMVVGYTLGRAFVYSTLETSLVKLPFEILQGAFGAVTSILLCFPAGLKKLYEHILGGKMK